MGSDDDLFVPFGTTVWQCHQLKRLLSVQTLPADVGSREWVKRMPGMKAIIVSTTNDNQQQNPEDRNSPGAAVDAEKFSIVGIAHRCARIANVPITRTC